MKKYLPLGVSLLISLGVGGLSAWATSGASQLYGQLRQPPLAPPAIVFPVVWSILFLLMGISAWLVWREPTPLRKPALRIYALQLVMNFLWSVVFFNGRLYWAAFVWLLGLLAAIGVMIFRFAKVSKPAAWLQLPYLLWVTFAGYLNLMIALLNG